MKTIITVIFFGILVHADDKKPAKNGGCIMDDNLDTKKDLDIQTFFSGSWFVTHVKGNEGTCREYKSNVDSSGTIQLTAEGQHKTVDQSGYTTTCTSSTSKQEGPFVFKCTHKNDETQRATSFGLSFAIIETDYNNYALVHRCTTYINMNHKRGHLLLLQRSKTGDSSTAKGSVEEHQMSLEQFQKNACL